jgi:hypothetical protein
MRMRWAALVARIGEMRNAYNISIGKPEGKRPLGRFCVGRRIVLEWILGIWGGKLWTGFIWLRIGTSGGLL